MLLQMHLRRQFCILTRLPARDAAETRCIFQVALNPFSRLLRAASILSPSLFPHQKVRHKLRIPEPAHSERPTPPHCFASPALSHFARTVARKLIISIKQSRALVFANRGIGQNKTVRMSLQTRQAVSVSFSSSAFTLPVPVHLSLLVLLQSIRHNPVESDIISSH